MSILRKLATKVALDLYYDGLDKGLAVGALTGGLRALQRVAGVNT